MNIGKMYIKLYQTYSATDYAFARMFYDESRMKDAKYEQEQAAKMSKKVRESMGLEY